ncbi:unnamed protein product [Durusdinium trenchii]|uniref:Poly [ADP-ribose] polymerase n=2 Tax=Durusdinium trenchii TaxID=1381693 RepID=A0ABP0T1E2_9DINO
MDAVIALHATALSLDRISCSQLMSRGVELAQHLGYKTGGIDKGSPAAQGMSIEAQASGGGVFGLKDGGVTASLQSIGASGYVKPEAKANLAAHMRRCGLISERDYLISVGDQQPLVVVDIPPYFSSPEPDLPMLVNDYRTGGYNQRKAEMMLAESRGENELLDGPCECSFGRDEGLSVVQIQRIENKQAFERFKAYETATAERLQTSGISTRPCVHEWLDRLADRNGLSRAANTVYLLHGTTADKVDNICRDGLQTRFSLEKPGLYGGGLYFTTSSCKAFQYTAGDGCIIICRVVLGEIELLDDVCINRLFPTDGFDSTHAKKGHTCKAPGELQVHDEYIVYHPAAVYPELVLRVNAA